MRCEDVERLLSLEEGEARVEPARFAEHLVECGACRGANPEVAWLMAGFGEATSAAPLPEVELGRTRRFRRWRPVAAAAIVLALSGIGLRGALFPSGDAEFTEPGVARPRDPGPRILNEAALHALTPVESIARARAAPASSLEHTVVSWHDGRRITSTVERSVWRARLGAAAPSGDPR